MRVLVVGAGVIGSVYAARLASAGHEVSLLARGSRQATLERDGVNLITNGASLVARPRIVAVDQLGAAVDVTIVAVRATQLQSALRVIGAHESDTVAFLQHLSAGTEQVRSEVGSERLVLAFPGIGGLMRPDGTIEYVEVAAQPTTIDATATHAEAFRAVVASTGMRATLEPDIDGWYATHSVFIACLGAGILARDGDARALADDPPLLRSVVQAIREGFAALEAGGTTVTPTALRVLFSRMPKWFAAAYWRRALRGPVGTVAIAPHTRASMHDEFAALCTTVLDQVSDPVTTPNLRELLTRWAHDGDRRDQPPSSPR